MKKIAVAALLALGFFIFYRANYEVPILMYHHVGDSEESNVNVSLNAFERQMEFLKIHHQRVMSLEDYIGHRKLGQPVPWNTVVITFDDGYLDNFTNAFPVLKRMGLPATIFMITENIGKDGWLGAEDLKILELSGVTIGSHTLRHAFLPDLKKEEIIDELRKSRNQLEKIIGHPVFVFSYPGGGVTREAKALVAQEGYQGAVTTNYGSERRDVYALRRIKIGEHDGNLFRFWAKLSGLYTLNRRCVEIV